jgi:hypothetical protein
MITGEAEGINPWTMDTVIPLIDGTYEMATSELDGQAGDWSDYPRRDWGDVLG